jgi:transposase
VFVEVTSQQLSQADAARKWGVDVSTVIKLRRLAKDVALAAFAASRPGRPASMRKVCRRCRICDKASLRPGRGGRSWSVATLR